MSQDLRGPAVGYLVSHYPAWYAPYIASEIALLRHHGVAVHVVSLGHPDPGPGGRDDDGVYHVAALSWRAHVRAHLRALRARPAAYARGLLAALRAGRRPGMPRLSGLVRFAKAVAAGDELARRGVRHCHAHFASNVAVLVARVFPLELSLTLHGPTDFAEPERARLAAKVAAAAFVRVVSRAGHARLADHCRPEDAARIRRLPVGVDPSRFRPRRRRQGGARVHFICVARLAPVKGHALLLAALAEVVATGRDVALTVVGDGALRGELERDAARRGLVGRVAFTGAVPHHELPALYAAADAFVLASYAEGLPVALTEAMAMALPCVAPDVDGVPELLADGVTGLLVPPGDARALAAALARIADHPELRETLGDAGRRLVLAEYDSRRSARALAAVFRDLLGDAAAARALAGPVRVRRASGQGEVVPA